MATIVPDLGNLTCVYTYMGWSLVTAPDSLQYKLREEAGEEYDSEGFAKIEGRYVIACTQSWGNVGDIIDFHLDNGMTFKCIIGDIKSSGDSNYSKWGHLYGNSISVIEFVVQTSTWYPSHPNPGTPSFHPEWKGQVTSADNIGNYWSGFNESYSTTLRIINARKRNGDENAYVGTIGDDGYVYFNDINFYRVKLEGTWEDNVYILNRSRHSWSKTTVFVKLSMQNINNGAGSVAPGGKGVEDAIKWILAIADDASHGYDQGNRWGPDYDCSSLIYEGFRVGGGFTLPTHSGYTGSMVSDFTSAGFTWLPGKGNSQSECQRGDILLNQGAHVELYLGEGMNVGAHINEFGGTTGGQTGDQTGNEISKGAYYSFPWDGILRYEG